jgi:hypothetical protein
MEKLFFEAIRNRRTYYAIGKEPIVSPECIQELVGEAVKYSPSAFNSQSSRVVVLLGEHHEKLWDIATAELKKIIPAESFQDTRNRIDGAFRSGFGTILFFEDMSVVESLQQQFPLYKENFPVWSQQSSGMLQFVVWTALELKGLGASLQHYNPVIDEAVKEAWSLSEQWKLIAQMPFGNPVSPPGAKEFMPIEQRVKIYK